jgi:LysR family nitrogen assimilation transcriptional regulator
MHPDNPLAKHKKIKFKNLANEALALPSQPHSLRKLLDSTAKIENVKLNVKIDADSLLLRKELVQSNTASTIISKASIQTEINNGSIKVAALTEPELKRKLFLAMPTDRPTSNATLKVTDVIRQEIKKLVNTGIWDGSLLMREK